MQKDFDKNNLNLDCEACKDMLYDYVSDNLSAENKTAVEKHIGLCPRCAEELKEVKGLISIMNGFEDIPMPKGLELSVNKALEETANEIKTKNKRLRFRRVASAVVPFAAAAVLAIGLYSGGVFDKYINSDKIFDDGSDYTEHIDNKNSEKSENTDNTNNTNNTNNSNNSNNLDNMDKGENPNGLSDYDNTDKSNKSDKSENITDKNKVNKNNGAVSDKSNTKKANNKNSDNNSGNSSSKSQTPNKSNSGADAHNSVNTKDTENNNSGEVSGTVPQNQAESNTDTDAKAEDGAYGRGGSGRVRSGVTEDAESQPAVVTYGLDDLCDESTDEAADKAENSEKTNNYEKPNISEKSDNYDKSDNSKNIGQRVPASCEIVTSNPDAYASLGLSIGGGNISYTLWESIRAIAVSTGDTLNAYDFADASVNSTISVTLIKK